MCCLALADKPTWNQQSENEVFNVSLQPEQQRYQIGQYHNWIITIKDSADRSIDNAAINIAGGMIGHGHGLPSQPIVTKHLKNGNYLIEGLLFNMSGEWTLDFYIQTPTLSDRVRFNVNFTF
jgi:hypothetical protein